MASGRPGGNDVGSSNVLKLRPQITYGDCMSQNTSHAVMAQRVEPGDSLDDFPTPPWATRALIEHVIGPADAASLHCLEPACGRGHMAAVMTEYFGRVTASDVAVYGYAPPRDFLS